MLTEYFLDRADNLIQDYKSNEFPPIVIINRILRVIKNNELIKYKYNPAEMNKYCHSLKNKHSWVFLVNNAEPDRVIMEQTTDQDQKQGI